MAIRQPQAIICSLLLCLFSPLCWQDPALRLTAAAPATEVLLTVTDVTEIVKRAVSPQAANVDDDLRSRIESAVNSSFSGLNISVDQEILTEYILQKLKDGGISSVCSRKCKPRSMSYLAEKFISDNAPADCFNLQEIELQYIEDGLTIYALSGNTTCNRLRMTYHSDCLPQIGLKPVCSSSIQFQEIIGLSDNFFPRYILNVICYGCSSPRSREDLECLVENRNCYYSEKRLTSVYPLKRRTNGECDEKGFEVWELDIDGEELSVNGGCDCNKASI